MNGIVAAGWRKADNNEILQINFDAYVAENPTRVLTFTTVGSTGANIAATGGSFQLYYCNGYGATFVSPMIAFNALKQMCKLQSAI